MKMAAVANAWEAFWEPRTAREKMLLGWGGAVLAVAIAYSVLWAPAEAGRAALHETLPTMHRQLAQMTAQADEARAPPVGAAPCAAGASAMH